MQLIANDVFLVSYEIPCKCCRVNLSSGLPSSQTDIDASRKVIFVFLLCLFCTNFSFFCRVVLAFYCIGTLDLLGVLEEEVSLKDREIWRDRIWAQQASMCLHSLYCFLCPPTRLLEGKHGSGFRPSPFMTGRNSNTTPQTVSVTLFNSDIAELEFPDNGVW